MRKKPILFVVVVLVAGSCIFLSHSRSHHHDAGPAVSKKADTQGPPKAGEMTTSDKQAQKEYANAEELARTGHIDDGIKILDKIAKDNKGTWYEPFSQYQKANWLCWAGKEKEGRRVYETVKANYPESYLSIRSARRLEELDLKAKRVQAAINTTDIKPLTITTADKEDSVTTADCGPECLLEVCKMFKVSATKGELKELAKTTSKGTSMLNLAKAAQNKGIVVKGQMVNYAYLQDMDKPVIAWINGNHYILIKEVGGASIKAFDPGQGEKIIARTQFCDEWHGQILALKPASTSSDNQPIHH